MTQTADPAPEALRRALRSVPGLVRLRRWLLPIPPAPPAHVWPGLEAYWTPPQPIETEVPPETLKALFARTQGQWTRLGETDPHWSVLTDESFRAERLDEAARARFYETGLQSAGLLDQFEARAGARIPRGVCLELGCGVGRVTAPLSRKFKQVIGVDISAGNLQVARARLAEERIKNVELRLLETVEALAGLPDFDFLFSVIVLQHNSPPVQAYVLDRLLAKVRPGGGVLFQTATNLPGYGFSAEEYLQGPDTEMEIHAIPQALVMRLLRKHGLEVQEVLMDPWLGSYGSNTVFAVRDSPPR